ncbi:MAG TPA: YtxH domain-containing protein [Polyangiaceae bacterium]|nr:YtxH domain-containing protein [Polyangiaceae bacterium]
MIKDTIRDGIDSARGISSDTMLAALGLERRRDFLERMAPAVGLFVAGAAVGAGVALLLAPKSGREMRRDIQGGVKKFGRAMADEATDVADQVRATISDAGNRASGSSGSRALENGARSNKAAQASKE